MTEGRRVSVDGVAQRRRNALGLCTKELCSALFVSGRAAPDVLDHDLTVLCTTFAGGVLDPAEISFDVDHRRGAVVGTLPDGSSRRAVASGDKGAALVEDRRHDLPGRPLWAGDLSPREWPHGDGFRPDPRHAPLHDGVRAHLTTTGAPPGRTSACSTCWGCRAVCRRGAGRTGRTRCSPTPTTTSRRTSGRSPWPRWCPA
ncbi:hypothetical protein [Pseudonocardia xinjiangensis]|uniref:hypothetical protein n=1 Tax=Pseudonocardia xinjiangensis TaxID=75289 RepID=UPI001FEA0C74|nr:hypothetical protein [Pseudonocardia xinjiangensis]